ncbi:MAG: DUF342 domain-containing protein [Spirochaetales bacterium]|nr:DUF342 domain-containing protein [Spirochaetales bacterium]
MNREIKGILTVETDADRFYCYLRFQKQPDGLPLNTRLVQDVLDKNRIKQKPDPKRVEDFLKKCSADMGPSVRVLITEGIRPEPPFEEQYIWDAGNVPEDKKPLLESVRKKAAPPEIYEVEIIRENVSETIKKKGKFPFSAAKAETVTRQVKKEIKKKAEITPEVLEYHWVYEGSKIARIRKGMPAKDGIDIFGQPVPYSGNEEIRFYLSEKFRKDRDVLYALSGGVLRIGKDWADIVEITDHKWELAVSKDNVSCFLNFTPGLSECSIPDPAEIIAAAVDKGIKKESLVSEGELEQVLIDAAENGKVLDGFSISSDSDGFFRIDISKDKLRAVLNLQKGRGRGKQITLKEVGQAVLESKIKGYNQKKIQEDLSKFYSSNILELKDYLLAQGKAPEKAETRNCHITVRPQDPELTKKIKSTTAELEKDYTDKYPSLESFSWKDIEHMAPVKKGQEIARFSPEKRAIPGRDVFGNPLGPEPASIPDLGIYENVIIDKDQIFSAITGILDFCEDEEGNHKFRVRQHRDCDVRVEISGNKMTARISMIREYGTGIGLTKEYLLQKIGQEGVRFGIIESILDKALAAARKKGKVVHVPFAKGHPPKHASEKGIRFFIDFEEEKKLNIRKDGSADFRDRGEVTKVLAGQLIAELPGSREEVEDGTDVCGNRLAARQSVVNQLQFGKNVEVREEEGKKKVLAKISGEVVYEKNLLDISSSHYIKGNVDMKTGNIKYPGDVKIAGSVLAGFYIMAGGNVQIGQGVEGSLVSAEGNIEIAQGVVGAKKAVIRAKEKIRAVFAEQATLLAVGNINIQKSCLHCNIKTNGKLNLLTEKGYLIGGHIYAREGLNVMNIGNEQGTKTRISFGQDYLVADQIQLEEKEVDKLKVRLVEIDKNMKSFIADKSPEKLDQTRKEKLKCMKLMESRNVRLFTLRERFEEHCPSEINVRGTLYPGTQFESHGRFFEVSSERSGVCIFFNPEVGHIEQRSIKTQ